MPLLEREPALAVLRQHAREADGGDARLVLVAGEAGAGKSTLVEEFARELPGARWWWAACDGSFVPRPLGPLFDLADRLGGELADLCRQEAPREQLFAALLRRLGRPGALDVVVVEDVHWADEATLDLLRYLARRIRTTRVLLLVTYRDDELATSYPLRVTLGDLVAQRGTRRVGVGPLSVAAVGRLAEGSTVDVAELHRITGGNPFYVAEVLRAGLDRVPASASDAVLARAARLSRECRAVLDVAALVGTGVEPDLLEEVTQAPPDAVDDAVRSGLLVEDGAVLRFRHEIARRAVEAQIPAFRRTAAHGRILVALRQSGCRDDARLAFHAEEAGDRAAALHHATVAGQRAAELGSHREAAAQFERALRVVGDEPRAELAARHDRLADELRVIDRFAAAAVALERALELWREAGDPLREGDTLHRLGSAYWRLCRGEDAASAKESAVRTLEPLGPSVELVRAYRGLAGDLVSDGRFDEAAELARRAQELAERLGAYDELSVSLNVEAVAVWSSGGNWEPLLQRALEIALDKGAELPAGFAYVNLHELNCARRAYADAEPYYVEGLAYCDEHELGTYQTCLEGVRTTSLERRGRWQEATALAESVLNRVLASPLNRMIPMRTLGTVLARRGEPEAGQRLDVALTAALGTGEPQYVLPARLARAEAFWLQGDLAAARAEAELADDVADAVNDWDRGEVAVWLHRLGSARPAREPLAEPYRLSLEGDGEAAAALWLARGCPYDAALALLDSNDEPALRRALAICEDLGATATASVVRRSMRRLGLQGIPAGRRATTRSHPLGLTRRQQDVLDLLGVGRTNNEIAERLFLSPRTVDHHVSAILEKLQVSTRGAAAAVATRLKPASPPT